MILLSFPILYKHTHSVCLCVSEWMLLMVDYGVYLKTEHNFYMELSHFIAAQRNVHADPTESRTSFDQNHAFETFKYQPISFGGWICLLFILTKQKKQYTVMTNDIDIDQMNEGKKHK